MASTLNKKQEIRNNKPTKRSGWACVLFALTTLQTSVFILFSASPAYGWGSLTHVAICRDAGGGEEAAMGAHAPDMISLNSVTTGNKKYDFAHNPYDSRNDPVFGDLMVRNSGDGFAQGWRIHQISDGVVHGTGGYSNTKSIFTDLPNKYSKDLNHGTVELIIDAIILNERFGPSADLWLPDRSRLIHETAVAFYNEKLPSGVRIPRSSIISCETAVELGGAWESWIITNVYLAEIISEEPWFPDARQSLADFRPLFAESVARAGSQARSIFPRHPTSLVSTELLTGLLFPAAPAYAAEQEQSGSQDKDGFYRFVALVSARARVLGQGKVTKDSVKLTLKELEGERGLSEEERLWAKTLLEMAIGNHESLTDLNEAMENFGASLDAGGEAAPAKGAAGGRRGGFLPCLPGIILASLVVTGIVRFMRRL